MITKRVAGMLTLVVVLVGSSTAFAAPKDKTKPTTPTNLHVTGVSDFSVSLAWNPATDNSGSLFYIIVSSAGVSTSASQTSATFATNHAAGTTYSFHVYAVDFSGNKSPNSVPTTVTLLPAGTPPSAPVLSATDVGPTYIKLSWTVPTDAGPPVRYWLYWNGQPLAIAHQTTTFTLYFLTPQTTHNFTVQARDGKLRFSPHSEVLTVTTPPSDPNDVTPPTTPAGLWGGSLDGATEFQLSWTPSTDDVTPQQYIVYEVYVNGVWAGATVGTTNLTDYGVIGENTVELIAVDSAGNESERAIIVFNL